MKFSEAIAALQRGLTVRRKADPVLICAAEESGLIVYRYSGKPILLTLRDIAATDWQIHVPRPGEN